MCSDGRSPFQNKTTLIKRVRCASYKTSFITRLRDKEMMMKEGRREDRGDFYTSVTPIIIYIINISLLLLIFGETSQP